MRTCGYTEARDRGGVVAYGPSFALFEYNSHVPIIIDLRQPISEQTLCDALEDQGIDLAVLHAALDQI